MTTVTVLANTVERATVNRNPNAFCCRIQVAVLGRPMKSKGQRKQHESDEQDVAESLVIGLDNGSVSVLQKDPRTTAVSDEKPREMKTSATRPRHTASDLASLRPLRRYTQSRAAEQLAERARPYSVSVGTANTAPARSSATAARSASVQPERSGLATCTAPLSGSRNSRASGIAGAGAGGRRRRHLRPEAAGPSLSPMPAATAALSSAHGRAVKIPVFDNMFFVLCGLVHSFSLHASRSLSCLRYRDIPQSQCSESPDLQFLIFALFLSMYLITVLGNLLIITAIISQSHLHTPMYFFLSNLSFVDICFTSTTVPKMLVNIQAQSKAITYEDCITQMSFFLVFAELDNLLLGVMAYDRYVAICHPLHYTVIMNPQLCMLLVLLSWVFSVLHASLQSLMVLQLSFCTDVEIPHFFCELNQLAQLTCSNNFASHLMMHLAPVLLAATSLSAILYSYSKIVSSICAISSAQGKYKAFSTCASHLSIVSLFYSTGLGVYLSSAVTQSSHFAARVSVMYTVVTPMLNPFIYSLRNKDVKKALERLLEGKLNCPIALS
ncbi:olfactory receptor 1354 [Cricetulus griseus]